MIRAIFSDPVVAAGPDHVFQLVNVAGKIWDKDGSSIQYFALNDFFDVGNDRLTDPYVIYDSISERWFASIFDVTTESYPLAVSLTNDPTGGWNIYDIKFVSCPDYGRFAVNNNLLVLSVNDFGPHCTDGFKGTQHAIIKKDDLIADREIIPVQITPPDITQFTMLPVQPIMSSSTLYMVSSSGFGTNNLQLLSITGEPPNAVITTNAIPIKQSDTPPQASQPGSQIKLDTLDGRISSASYSNDRIWATFTDRCFSPERSCIRLVEIDTQSNQALQDFNYAAENANIYHPALSMDKSGNLIVAFGISSSSIFPSIMATGRTSLDDPNSLGQPVYLIEGSAATQIADDDQIARYGDYATAALESNSNIWITNEYNKDTRWSTFIGSLSH